MEIKKIAELPEMEAAGEVTNVLVEDGGTAKRIPASALGGKVQPNWEQNDETAPDYIKNRPFYYTSYETHVIEYDDSNPNNVTLADGRTAYFIEGLTREMLGAGSLFMGYIAEKVGGETSLSAIEAEFHEGSYMASYTHSLPGNSFEIDIYFPDWDGHEINGITFPAEGTYVVKGPDVTWMDSTWNAWLYDIHAHRTVKKTIPEAFIPYSAKWPAQGGEPNMMLVTDGEGNAKWQERTHWVENAFVYILPETAATGSDGEYAITETLAAQPVVGAKYKVTWNDTEYECTANSFDSGGVTFVTLGDLSVQNSMYESTGEPFLLAIVPSEFVDQVGASIAVIPLDGSTEIRVSIQGEGEIVHPLDKKYLSNLRGQQTIILDLDTLTASVDFSIAYAMNATDLQNAFIVQSGTQGSFSVYGVNKFDVGGVYQVISFWIREFSDTAMSKEYQYTWYSSKGNQFGKETEHQVMPYGDTSEPYLRYNGTFWLGVSINKVKEDLGLAILKEDSTSEYDSALILDSATPGSTKRFKITVDDSGTITATEVT